MASEPLVSVIIANYNHAQFLGQAIRSVVAQTYRRLELIVVDDGSTDGSLQVVERYGDRLSLVTKSNGGHASAINAGFAASHGDLICWLDADDLYLPTKVERVVQAHRANPAADLIYHRLQMIDTTGVARHRPWPRDVWQGSIARRIARSGAWWPRPTTSAMAFPRRFLTRIHPMPEQITPGAATYPDAYAGDIAALCGSVAGLPAALACYRFHGGNDSAARESDVAQRMQQRAFEYDQLQGAARRLGVPWTMGPLQQSVEYARDLYLTGETGLPRTAWTMLRCPLLSKPSKLRELAKLVSYAVRCHALPAGLPAARATATPRG